MTDLTEKKCQVCEGGVPPLDVRQCQSMLQDVPGWELSDDKSGIVRKFSFKSFLPTMSFVNAVAFLAQKEGHHPDMAVGYNYCTITYTTHAIEGLSENDFICAAKINELVKA